MASTKLEYDTAIGRKENELQLAHRVHEQLRAEARDATAHATAEVAVAKQHWHDASRLEDELVQARSDCEACLSDEARASQDAIRQATLNAEAEAER